MKYILLLLISFQVMARENVEKYYQDMWCTLDVGETEYILPDKARVDCLTDTHAIEFDFADKWAESIGQARYYASETDRRAGVVLISEEGSKDMKYIQRWHNATQGLNIKLWIITP